MSLLFDQGTASPDEPSIAEAVSELIALPDLPLFQSFGSESEPSGDPFIEPSTAPAESEEADSRLGALIEDNLPPVLSAAFAADSLHNAEPLLHASSFQESEAHNIVTLDLIEDAPFAILLDQLLGANAPVATINLIDGPDWISAGLMDVESTLPQRLVIQTQLQTIGGDRLFSEDLSSLAPGTQLTVTIDVSDTRIDGHGLIGLEGDLLWNSAAVSVLSIDLADTLPLFRRTGDASDWADGQTTLVAAALPKGGAGEALGDRHEERFAEINLRLHDPSQPLQLKFTPKLYPAVGGETVELTELLNLGLDPQRMLLLQGQPLPDFNGSVALQLEVSLEIGESWIQPLQIVVAPRNDAPQATETLVELEPISEDTSDPAGARVDALFADLFSDVDGDQLAGVAITQIPTSTSAGVWQFSLADQPWQTLDSSLAISEASALVLLATDRVRFLPEPDWSSDQPVPALSLRLIDSSRTITSAGRVDARNPAADSAFSVALLQLSTRVFPVNDAPQAGPVETPLFRGRQGKAFSVSLPDGLFVDPDPTDVLSFSLSAVDASQPVPAWLTIDPATGRLSGVPTEAETDSFTLLVVAADPSGAEVSREIRLQIRPVDPNNNPPVAEPNQRLELLDTEQRVLHLAEIFQDPDPGENLTFSVEIPAAQAHWIVFNPETAELLLQPGLADVTAPNADVQVTLTAVDRDGESAVQLLSIVVLNTNQAPGVIQPAPPRLLRLNQGGLLELDLRNWFSDPDLPFGDSLSFSFEMASGDPVGVGSLGWLSWLQDGSSVVGRPGNTEVGSLDVVATATDRAGLSAQHTLRLLIDNVNDAPQLTDFAKSVVSVDENTPLMLDLSGWFVDPDAIHGDSFTLELSAPGGLPSWLMWTPETAILTGTPTAADLGVQQLRLRAADGLAITSHIFKIEVNNVNEAPVVRRSLAPLSLLQDASGSVSLSGVIADLDPGDLLRYSLRITDAEGTELALEQQPWLQLKTSADNAISRADRLLIQPVLRAISDGRVLTAEEVSRLPVGSEIDVEIQIEDNRQGVSQAGLFGADLTLSWNPAVLAPLSAAAATLKRGISASLPLFAAVNTSALDQGKLGLSAASAPAFGVGAVVGDQPAERFATVRMQLLDSGLPVVLSLAVNREEQGGLGLAWQEESDAEARLTLGSFSSSDRLDLQLTPGNAEVGRYTIELSGTDLLGLVAATAFDLDVINVNDAPSVVLPLPSEILERQLYRFRLADYFSDPDLIHGDQLSFQLSGTDLPSWVSLSSDQQWLELDVPALASNQPLELALTAADNAGVDVQQVLALTLVRKLLLGLDTQQRQLLASLDAATPEQRGEVIRFLRDGFQSIDAKERLFLPLQRSLQDWLDQPDRADSLLAVREVLFSENWLESLGEYVMQLNRSGDAYVLSDIRAVLDSVRPLSAPQLLLRNPSTALSYQALLEPIEFSADAEQGFCVVTMALPIEMPLNSLVKTVFIDGQLVAAPFAVRALDLTSFRAEALQAGVSPAAYQDLLDEQLNLFQLHRYPTGEALSQIRITPDTDLFTLPELFPRNQLDGSALLIDFDGDGVHDVARLLLLDGGFFDNDKEAVDRIDDPLFLANATPLALQPPLAAGGGASGAASSGAGSSATSPASDRPTAPIPADPSSPGSGSVDSEPSQPDVIPPDPVQPSDAPESSALGGGSWGVASGLRRSAGFVAAALGTTSAVQSPTGSTSLRSSLLSAFGGGPSQPVDDRQSAASGSTADLGVPSAQENSTPSPFVRGKRNPLAPLVQTLQRGFDALAEMDLVDYLALAAMVLPLTAQAGLQGGKQVKPFQLRLRKGNPATEATQPLVVLVFGESLLDPLLQVWIEQIQGRVRILNSLPDGEEPKAAPQLVGSSKLWLWQRVCHTARPGELVASCRQALQAIEREGFEGSGLDRDAWLARTLDLHQSRRGVAAAFVSNLDFMVQLIGCLANLGYSYESVVR